MALKLVPRSPGTRQKGSQEDHTDFKISKALREPRGSSGKRQREGQEDQGPRKLRDARRIRV